MKSKWSLVVHDVGVDFAHIWIGTLFSNERKFENFFVRLFANGEIVQEQAISKQEFERPFSGLDQRFFKLVRLEGLVSGKTYKVAFGRQEQSIDYGVLEERNLSEGSFRTLPTGLGGSQKSFVVALGSCFYNEADGGKTADAYSALLQNESDDIRPDVKFLVGDQVYLDIGLDSLSPVQSEIVNRIADDYASSWQELRQMLRNGGTWMLADDHEYWNNYPQVAGYNPYLWMITASNTVKSIWEKAAREGVENVQRVKPVRTFNIGSDLSFCLIDVRCHREGDQFMKADDFSKVVAWAESLTCPGVLVLSQPLIVKPGSGADKNLANFSGQYSELLKSLAASGHDVVILAGDVHYGRVASVPIGNKGGTLYEIISSPMSNLTGLDGKVAANTAKQVKRFPAVTVDGFPRHDVNYPSNWRISSQKVRSWFFPTNHSKTREHFFTLAFKKLDDGSVTVTVQAWRSREKGNAGLPRKQFVGPHVFTLR